MCFFIVYQQNGHIYFVFSEGNLTQIWDFLLIFFFFNLYKIIFFLLFIYFLSSRIFVTAFFSKIKAIFADFDRWPLIFSPTPVYIFCKIYLLNIIIINEIWYFSKSAINLLQKSYYDLLKSIFLHPLHEC